MRNRQTLRDYPFISFDNIKELTPYILIYFFLNYLFLGSHIFFINLNVA
jgi:hypothetical protein